jgi:hypothetical protein
MSRSPGPGSRTPIVAGGTARRWPALALACGLTGCGGSEPTQLGPGLNIVSGAGTTDTIEAELRQPLVLRVLLEDGQPLAAQHLLVESQDCESYLVCTALVAAPGDSSWSDRYSDSTDAQGYVRVRVKLGLRAGEARLRITAYESNQFDTATWKVTAGHLARIIAAPDDTTLYAGGGFSARAATYDRGGNPRTGDTWSFDPAAGLVTVAADGQVRAGGGIGRAVLVARAGSLVDTAGVSVVPHGELALSGWGLNTDIHTVQLDGSRLATVTAAGTWDGGHPAWVGAGPTLVYVEGSGGRGGTLRVSQSGGASHRLFTSSGVTDQQLPRVSRDGVWTYFQLSGSPATNFELWRVHLDGTGLERVGSAGAPSLADADPDPSPDGTRLAYATTRPDGTWHVVLRDLATGSDYPLGVPGRNPRWSPSGDRLAYLNTTDGEFGTIHVVRYDGSQDRLISPPNRPYLPLGVDWSPDAVWVVARAQDGFDLIEVATGQTLRLGWSSVYVWPAWRPE